MNILVTGATGKVGSRLTKRPAQRPDYVRALVRDRARAAELSAAGVELVEGDLLDAGSLAAAVRGIDSVVHCAAFFRGATAKQAQAVNDLGTQHLANAARAAGVKRFIFTSTGLVYGSTAAYPVSKLAAERFLLALEGLDVRVRRLPFGDHERARAFDTPLDGRRLREDLGFKPTFPRLADAVAVGAHR